MFNIKVEGFGSHSPFDAALATACAEVARRSALAIQITRPKTRAAMEEWFGDADIPVVWANLWRMEKVIQDDARTVTFVNAIGKIIRVEYNPHNIAQAPLAVAPATSNRGKRRERQGMKEVSAWVYPTDTRDSIPIHSVAAQPPGPGTPLFHTGSGIRLYLGYQTVKQAPIDQTDLVQTIYHELSHKVLGTNDHKYGRDKSKRLVADGRAIKNADNYGFFLLSVD